MAFGFGSFIEWTAKSIRFAVQLGVTLGRNLAEIGAAISRAGADIEAASLRRVYEAEKEERRATEAEVTGDTSEVPDPSGYAEAVTRQRRTFAWRVKVGYINPSTGGELIRYLTISSDTNQSVDDILSQVEQEMEGEYGVRIQHITQREIVSITRASAQQRL